MANSQNLEDMKLPELKEFAKQMGLRGTSTMCKPELLATLQAARNGEELPVGVTVRAPKAAKTAKVIRAPQPDAAEANTTDNADAATQSPTPAPAATEPQLDLPLPAADDVKKDETESRRTRCRAADDATSELRAARRRCDDGQPDPVCRKPCKKADETGDLLATLDLGGAAPIKRRRERHEDVEVPLTRRVRDDEDGQPRRRRRIVENSEETARDPDDILAIPPTQKHEETSEDGEQNDDHESVRRNRRDCSDRNDHDTRNDRSDRRNRRIRGRDRDNADDDRRYDDRDNRNDRNDRDSRREEPQEDLVSAAGIIDVLDSYTLVRTSGYLPGPDDVYVSMGQVKKYGLRKGDAVHGSIYAPREGDRRNQCQKFVLLQVIDSTNDQSVEEAPNRPQFSKLTPLYPQERLKQEITPNKLAGRIMSIVSSINKGQRGLVVSPPRAGKAITLQNIANSTAANSPEIHLMVVFVDERPEEVTDMERTVQGEVTSSTSDRPASDHTMVAELVVERAKRPMEFGQDVVVLFDSMIRSARAYSIAAPTSGRTLSGGVDAQVLHPSKKLFGAAHNIENGGFLTIISSALMETDPETDEVIFEEFKGTGNMELRLSREPADRRLFPAIDINAFGARREEPIINPQELPIIYRLRRPLGGMEPEQTYQTLAPRFKKTATNRNFLAAIVQQANTGNAINGN